jgi:DNA-binding transcriptional MerR regulator
MFSFRDSFDDAYDSKTASRLIGVSLRQIQYWDERGFVHPSVKLADGRGSKRLYSFHDLVCLKVAKELTDYGFTLQKVSRCLRPLREQTVDIRQLTGSLKYLTDGESLFVITDDRRKILDAVQRQFVLSLGIGSLVRDLSGRIARRSRSVERKNGQRLRQKRTAPA